MSFKENSSASFVRMSVITDTDQYSNKMIRGLWRRVHLRHFGAISFGQMPNNVTFCLKDFEFDRWTINFSFIDYWWGCQNRAMAFSIMTLSIIILTLMGLLVTLSIKTLWIECHYAECHYAGCRDLFIVRLYVDMLSVIVLNVVAPPKLYGTKYSET
jgi:hypothetical protein